MASVAGVASVAGAAGVAGAASAADRVVADVRRRLLDRGHAVLGRAVAPDAGGVHRRWLKLTVLNPTATADDYDALLDLVEATAAGPVREAGPVHELDTSGVAP